MTSKEILDIDDFRMPLTMDSNEMTKNSLPLVGTLTLDQMERAMIMKCMEQYGGNISKAAEALGISRAALYRRLEKLGIPT